DLETTDDKVLKYKSMAMHMVKQRVKLVVEPTSEGAFATAIADAEIGKIRGGGGQESDVEMMHTFTKSNLDIPEVKHPIYAGSSSGDLIIGPINLESYAQRLWQVTEDDKKKIYSTYRVAVGGATETAPSESGKRTQFKKKELTRAHVVAGYKHLGELVYEAMLDEKSPLHDAKLCALLAQKGDDQKAAVTKKGQNKRKATADIEKPEKTTEKTAEENASGGASAAETKEGTEVTEGTDPKTAAGKKPRTSNGSSSSGTPAAGGGSSIDVLMNQLKNLRKT
ncbi:unnamed protein product, partial [Durusdinium trenchii]